MRRHARISAALTSPATRVGALSTAMTLAAVVLGLTVIRPMEPLAAAPFLLPLWAVVAMVVLSEVLVIHLEARGDVHSLTFSEVPVVVGLVLCDPVVLVLGRLVGGGLTLWLHRRQSLRKLSFNVPMMTLETVLILVVYRAVLDGSGPREVQGVVAAVAATLTGSLFAVVAVTTVISLHSGRLSWAVTRRVAVASLLSTVALTGIGLGVAAALWDRSWSAVPLAGLAGLTFLLYRSYFSLSQRYASLQSLHGFTRVVGQSIDLSEVSDRVLRSARELLRAGRAALVLLGEPDDEAVVVLDDDAGTTRRSLPRADAEAIVAGVLGPDGEARLVPGGDAALVPALGRRLSKDAMAAPVHGERGRVGVVVVADRLADVSTFDAADVKLLETLVNQASVSLENGRLFRRLQHEAAHRTHQAMHDALTGLPNRLLLTERLERALRDAEGTDHAVGVLLMDLAAFKEVNETLGHQAGDALLGRVCDRIEAAAPAGATLARMGGDQFVLLLPRVHGEGEAVAVGERLVGALEMPFFEQELALNIGVNIGITVSGAHGRDAATLLQRAEVALFNAKAAHTGVEAYRAEGDPFTPQRLALAGELREAIGRGQIEVHYQPQLDLRTGRIVGAEALVRWPHARRGLLSPNEFIAAAERTGVIRPLTNFVLDSALEHVAGWRASGLELSVSVNLSMRSLLDPHLPGDVADRLRHHGVAPEVLTLELTESSIMSESRRSLGVLGELHDMGVRLSIDDFGTGYSSLSHLRALPVSEIKVDRSFVANVTLVDHDATIVRLTIELGHQLGLQVVAEGAESRDDLDRLGQYGCDVVQGYVVSRPRPAAGMRAWLLDRPMPGPTPTGGEEADDLRTPTRSEVRPRG